MTDTAGTSSTGKVLLIQESMMRGIKFYPEQQENGFFSLVLMTHCLRIQQFQKPLLF